jgi:hypothetical protein
VKAPVGECWALKLMFPSNGGRDMGLDIGGATFFGDSTERQAAIEVNVYLA